MMTTEKQMRDLAELQHGVVGRHQSLERGISWESLNSLRVADRWELLSPRVVRLRGVPQSDLQLLMASALDGGPGTRTSHFAGAALWGLPGFPFGPLEVSRPRGLSGMPTHLARLHQPRYLPDHLCTEVRGIPVTTLAFTIYNLAPLIKPARLERVIDTVAGRSPGTLVMLHQLLPEVGERGRPGIRLMRQLLAERPPGQRRPTGLEARFERILAEGGERPMRRQIDVGGHDWIGRIDYVDDDTRLFVEVDSATYHSSNLDKLLDERRDAKLRALGYEVLRIPEEFVWHNPPEVLRLVREARRRPAACRSGTRSPRVQTGIWCQNALFFGGGAG